MVRRELSRIVHRATRTDASREMIRFFLQCSPIGQSEQSHS